MKAIFNNKNSAPGRPPATRDRGRQLDRMYVCLCMGITERQVAEAIDKGARSILDVMCCTGAGTRCGSCQPTIAAMLDRARAADRAAAAPLDGARAEAAEAPRKRLPILPDVPSAA